MKRPTGQEVFDGFVIEAYEGKFAPKAFDVGDNMGQRLGVGDEVLLIAQCRLKPPAFKEDSEGDLKRVHIFEPNEVTIVADGDTWNEIEAIVGVVGISGQARLFNPLFADGDPDSAPLNTDEPFGSQDVEGAPFIIEFDEETGEISTPEVVAAEHERARARAFDGDYLDDVKTEADLQGEPAPEGVERFGERPVNSDPVLLRFLNDESVSGGR